MLENVGIYSVYTSSHTCGNIGKQFKLNQKKNKQTDKASSNNKNPEKLNWLKECTQNGILFASVLTYQTYP